MKQSQETAPLFKSAFLNTIFGPDRSTLITRSAILLAVLGTVAILLVGLLRPDSSGGQQTHLGAKGQPVVGWHEGDRAPNFTLQTPEGSKLSLSDYRGKPVLLNFWYATCPGCLTEIPALQRFYTTQKQGGKDFVTLGINTLDSAADTRAFVQQRHLSYPVVLDQDQQVIALYNINATPTSYFIDRQGIIRAVVVAPLDEAALQRYAAQIGV